MLKAVRAEEEIPTRTLVMAMVADDGSLDAGELYDVATACGMSDQQVRLCLRRLVIDGTLTHLGGRGRKGVFRAGAEPESRVLPELTYVEFAYEQDAGREPWDGRWRLVAFNLDRDRRSERDELRTRLLFLGGAPLHAGLYVSPNPWDAFVEADAERLGIGRDLLRLETDRLDVGGEDDPSVLAPLLWPLDAVGAGYERFREATERRLEGLDGEAPVMRVALTTVVEFARAIGPDPLLPAEMLPDDWPGRAARRLMVDAAARFEQLAGPTLPPVLHRLRDVARPTPIA